MKVSFITMDLFRRTSTNPKVEEYESSLKANIKAKLIESIKDIQSKYAEGNPSVPIESNELTYAFVTVLEAIFIHGLKGQANRAVRVKSSSRNLPSPSFWPFVLVSSHKETIGHIEGLKAVTTDIGRGRAWIRLALNDGLLGSYLVAMVVDDKTTLSRHYQRQSILRDADLMDILIRYLRGIEIYRFDLALNSGLLNRWATGPLVLAGLFLPENNGSYVEAASEAIDAAASLRETGTVEAGVEAGANSTSNDEAFEVIARPAGYLNRGLLNEDEALKLILAGVSPVTFSGSSSNAETPVGTPPAMKKSKTPSPVNLPAMSEPVESVIAYDENPVTTAATTQFDFRPLNKIEDEEEIESGSVQSKSQEVFETPEEEQEDEEIEIDVYRRSRSRSSRSSFYSQTTAISETEVIEDRADAVKTQSGLSDDGDPNQQPPFEDNQMTTLIRSKRAALYRDSSKSSSSSNSLNLAAVPYLAGFIDSWLPFTVTGLRHFDTPPKGNEGLTHYGFSLQPHVQVGVLSEVDSQQLMLIFDKVVQEEGLDLQNYECAECTKAIGTIFGPAKICAYTKRYYCQDCHWDETSTIPAKIMYNWDFRTFRVCHKAKLFLSSVNIEPIIDVKSFNAELHNLAPDLQEVFDLRRKLRYVDAYLSTCKNGTSADKTQFHKMLWPRSYLYEDIDMYAIRDLEEIHWGGKLVNLLNSAFSFAFNHITKCVLCSGKGFICEICREDQVLFPFDFDSIMSCKNCFTVFHLDCSVTMASCPKCDRIEARNLNWQISLSKAQRCQNALQSSSDASD